MVACRAAPGVGFADMKKVGAGAAMDTMCPDCLSAPGGFKDHPEVYQQIGHFASGADDGRQGGLAVQYHSVLQCGSGSLFGASGLCKAGLQCTADGEVAG